MKAWFAGQSCGFIAQNFIIGLTDRQVGEEGHKKGEPKGQKKGVKMSYMDNQ